MKRSDFVRPSRDGDQFHYHWAARQCLMLLSEASGLVAVTVEGASAIESDGVVNRGDELIDVGLYYGSEYFSDAKLVRYVQLKHSTRRQSVACGLRDIKKTLQGFARRYEDLLIFFPSEYLAQKVRFEFTTNRPIAADLLAFLKSLTTGDEICPHALQDIVGDCVGLDEKQSVAFLRTLSLCGGEPDLWSQRNLLAGDIGAYLPGADSDSPIQLKELVTRKATTEFESNPSIRRHDVLRVLKVTEEDLFPAPNRIEQVSAALPREREAEILEEILVEDRPIVIHAEGGVGKSMLVSRLATMMPHGSVAIVYDCFGNGLYRNSLHLRHRHCDVLVQIANELASLGLCYPLIPSCKCDVKQYMRAFVSRLNQAVGFLRASNSGANICIFIDAADNAVLAAAERHEPSFVRDLIREALPKGVRIAFTCRTHRHESLNAPPGAREIELLPFNESETTSHLRSFYPDASQKNVEEFAFLTSSNPRVQALALIRDLPLDKMLRLLGPEPTTVDGAIGELLQRAVDNIKDQVGEAESAQIDMICRGLAVLRPLIPIAVLAHISGVSESAVRSFALDFGRPLLVKGSSLHFFDEPAETWFREKFGPDREGLRTFAKHLRPIAVNSAYAASALPQLLLSAGQVDELVELALSGGELPTDSPLERRDVELQRVLFALKACLDQGRYVAAAKLALKAGGEAAGQSRQNGLIRENTDIAAILLSPDRIDELVSRRTFDTGWIGSHHTYDAGLLSGRGEFAAEAMSRLRMAIDWLYAWAQQPHDQGILEKFDDRDRVELAMALLRLRGAKAAANFLRGWGYRPTAFTCGKLLARRLMDIGEHERFDELALAAGNDVWLLLGLAVEGERVGRHLPVVSLARLLRLLADRRVKLAEFKTSTEGWDILCSVRAVVASAVRVFPDKAERWCKVLQRYLPVAPPATLAGRFGFDRMPLLRAYALESVLLGKPLVLLDVAPPEVRKELEEKSGFLRSGDASTFANEMGGLLPWLAISAEIMCGHPVSGLHERISAAVKATAVAERADYYQRYNFQRDAALEWLQILREVGATDSVTLDAYRAWLKDRDQALGVTTLTTICRGAARSKGLEILATDIALAVYGSLERSREDAETRANLYLELARAIFPVNNAEAAVYFNRAVEISSRIGEENLARWDALLNLAEAAAQRDCPCPQSAYRLARAAELTYEYVVRDKHFAWIGTVEALAGLCGASSLAILSRWRDRRFGQIERLLPVAVYHLRENGLLPSHVPIVLSGLDVEWARLADLEHALTGESQVLKQRLLALVAYRYMRCQAHKPSTWERLGQIGDSLEVDFPEIKRLACLSQSSVSSDQAESYGGNKAVDRNKPDWERFFDGVDMTDSVALKVAYDSLRKYDPPYEFEEFFKVGVARCEVGAAPAFVNAVAGWCDFGVFKLRDLLDAVLNSSVRMISMRNAIRNAVLVGCRAEPWLAVRDEWRAILPFKDLYNEGIVTERDVVKASFDGFSECVEFLDAEKIFQIIDPLAACLSPCDANEVLNFGLNLLEDTLLPEDGDGVWHDALQPPTSCVDALAGFVWAGLGSPIVATRWEHAHVVRIAVELEWTDFLVALARRAVERKAFPFVDSGFVFYEWDARQWLLLGLARGALDQKVALLPFWPFLKDAVEEEHVVIREIASRILSALLESEVVDLKDVVRADAVNVSPFPNKKYRRWAITAYDKDVSDEFEGKGEESFYFGIDVEAYWFAPLGDAFGVSQGGIKTYASRVLRERFDTGRGGWQDDARHKKDIFQDRETWHSHGALPRTYDLATYQAYHAMMIVAARLLANRPVRKRVGGSANDFQVWLREYLITCPSGRWLADWRGPRFVCDPPKKNNYNDKTWCWGVTADYLDEQLITDDGLFVFWGNWSSGYGRDAESVSVRSSLVPRTKALGLLRKLQARPEVDDILLPSAAPHERSRGCYSSMVGWVDDEDEMRGVDRDDPWAVGLHYPGPRPCIEAVKRLGIIQSGTGQVWEAGGGELLRRELWADVVGYGREKSTILGSRLSGNLAFVRLLRETHPDDSLVLSVSIRRALPDDLPGRDERWRFRKPYVQYYVMGNDGVIRSISCAE